VITGLDDQGRGCVIRDEVIATDIGRAKAGRDTGTLCLVATTNEAPPNVGFDRPGTFELHDTSCPPGGSKWVIVGWEPNVERTTVRTDTLDYDIVLEGSCELLLETGSVNLGTGDCVVIPGLVHGWRAGPDGVVLSAMLIGLDPVG
jgi:hypothetical protein